MRSGRLRHLAVIEQPSTTATDRGYPEPSWSTFATIRCDVQDVTGRQRFKAQHSLQQETTTLIVMRYLPGVTADMRVTVDGQTYEILNGQVDRTLRRDLTLECRRFGKEIT